MTQTTQSPSKRRSILWTGLGIAVGLTVVAGAAWLWTYSQTPAPASGIVAPIPAPRLAAAPPQAKVHPAEPEPEPEPVDPEILKIHHAQELLETSIAAYQKLSKYQTIFDTTEMNDEGEWEVETSLLRFEKPFTLMMNFSAGKKSGMQLLYAQGKFNDDIHVRMPGFIFKMIPLIAISPDDPRVVGKNKHSIRKAGIGSFLEEFGESFAESVQAGNMKILTIDEIEVRGEKATLVDINYGMPFEYPRTSVAFSKRTNLPLEVKLYKNQQDLVESYRYLQLVVNPAPDDAQFVSATDPRIVEKFLLASKS